MKRRIVFSALVCLGFAASSNLSFSEDKAVGFHKVEHKGYVDLDRIADTEFTVHQKDRPQPPRLLPIGECISVPAPSDAIVLFDGKDTDQFQANEWLVEDDGVLTATKGGLQTKQAFGDFQLHLEWNVPNDVPDKTGNYGNSGIYIMNRYEIQIFDSYRCKIYADGSAGAIYGQTPPLVNVSRKPGEWQSYDIVFTAPVFDGETLKIPARITAFHNNVLIQNDTKILAPTTHRKFTAYEAHPAKLPFFIQAHGSPVKFRNIWIREI